MKLYGTNTIQISSDQDSFTFLSSVVYIVVHSYIYFSSFKTVQILRGNPAKQRRNQSWEEAKS